MHDHIYFNLTKKNKPVDTMNEIKDKTFHKGRMNMQRKQNEIQKKRELKSILVDVRASYYKSGKLRHFHSNEMLF